MHDDLNLDLYASFGIDEDLVELGIADALIEAGDPSSCDPLSSIESAQLVGLLEDLPEHERHGDEPGRHAPRETSALDLDELLLLEAAAAWPIARDCSTRYRARRSSGTRRLSTIRLGVVHCTQGSTAAGAAAWFANPASRGSAHVVVDGTECYRTLPPSVIPWGAAGVNGVGWHLELAGFAERSRAEWLRYRGTLTRGAYKLAQNGRGRFPMAFLTDRQLADLIRGRGNVRGVCSHRGVSRVYGGSHWDPGPHFPWDVFMGLARTFERQLAAV